MVLSYYEKDVHIVNILNGNTINHVLWYHIKHWHTLKEGQVILNRSPEFLFKHLIYIYLLKTDHAPGEPLVGPFSLELYLEQL